MQNPEEALLKRSQEIEGEKQPTPEKPEDKAGASEKKAEISLEIAKTEDRIEATNSRIAEVRAALGLPHKEDQPPSVVSAKQRVEKLTELLKQLETHEYDLEDRAREMIQDKETQRGTKLSGAERMAIVQELGLNKATEEADRAKRRLERAKEDLKEKQIMAAAESGDENTALSEVYKRTRLIEPFGALYAELDQRQSQGMNALMEESAEEAFRAYIQALDANLKQDHVDSKAMVEVVDALAQILEQSVEIPHSQKVNDSTESLERMINGMQSVESTCQQLVSDISRLPNIAGQPTILANLERLSNAARAKAETLTHRYRSLEQYSYGGGY